ncbi:MAG: class I adenylate-forming enzyme family protein [Clostridia bacterium]|nr:class I adenylate-forming enzyme family protein [Clostridia bacterium]
MEQTKLTGYPSIDKPWLKYYSEKDLAIKVPDMSLSQYLRDCNRNNLFLKALSFYGKTYTYQELFENIDRFSRFFQNLGVKENESVALAMPLTPDTVFMMYGLDQIGAVANLIDPRIPTERMRFYINLTEVKVGCITTPYLNTMIEAAKDSMLETIIPVSPLACMNKTEQKRWLKNNYSILKRTELIAQKNWMGCVSFFKSRLHFNKQTYTILPFDVYAGATHSNFKIADYREGKTSIIEYTSGTTGVPKGLELTAKGMNVTAAQLIQINQTVCGESLLGIMPPFISYGAVTGIHMSLCAGFELHLIPNFTVESFPKLILDHKPNNVICVPSMFSHVIESKLLEHEDMSFIKRIIFGGDRTTPEFEEKVNKWLYNHNSLSTLIKGGGMAEYSSCAFETPFDKTKKPGVYGIPLPLVDAKVMKDDYTECKYNEIGEIYLSSPQEMRGYINNDAETEAFFFIDENGKKWGRSGDLGFVDQEGFFILTSRKKQMIVRPDGHNVFPVEIERVILENKQVENCVVIGIKDDSSIIGEYPVAFIELRPDIKNTTEPLKNIIAAVENRIPVRDRPKDDGDYVLIKIPYTSEGKIDRETLRRFYRQNQTKR